MLAYVRLSVFIVLASSWTPSACTMRPDGVTDKRRGTTRVLCAGDAPAVRRGEWATNSLHRLQRVSRERTLLEHPEDQSHGVSCGEGHHRLSAARRVGMQLRAQKRTQEACVWRWGRCICVPAVKDYGRTTDRWGKHRVELWKPSGNVPSVNGGLHRFRSPSACRSTCRAGPVCLGWHGMAWVHTAGLLHPIPSQA